MAERGTAERVTVERVTVDIPAADRVTVERPADENRAEDRHVKTDRQATWPVSAPGRSGHSLNEREEARLRLQESVDALVGRANLQVQMQKEPLKMLGGASAVGAAAGALLGIVVGRRFQRTKKIYVDADSPEKDQKALIQAQKKEKGGTSVGGALLATVTTLGFKILNDRVLTPKLEEMAHGLLDRAGQEGGQKASPRPGQPRSGHSRSEQPRSEQPRAGQSSASARPSLALDPSAGGGWSLQKEPSGAAPAGESAVARFLKRDDGAQGSNAARVGVPGGPSVPGTGDSIAVPVSRVEAKAQGSPIDPNEKTNPNIR